MRTLIDRLTDRIDNREVLRPVDIAALANDVAFVELRHLLAETTINDTYDGHDQAI